MSQYHYPSLPLGPDIIRLLRLMPYENERTAIQCELFEYPLQDQGKGTHLYEALSYTWGGSEKPCSISLNKQNLAVTENLHAALLHLRHRFLERILWVDAICIDQNNLEEQGQQVQLMAKIYSKANRVLVWLGDTTNDTEGALEDIHLAANAESTERLNQEPNQQAILKLLQRPWFQRIWVLQEVAAARHVVIMCGSTEIDGYAFCLGLKSLKLSYAGLPELQSLPSVTYLIERAGLRSKYTTNLPERFSLNIRCLAELVDMFHTREASDARDKVYALLGMSSDNPDEAGLRPDYEISWKELFQRLIKFVLGTDVSVETSRQRAVIKSKGYILGQVSSVTMDDGQNVNITSRNAAWDFGGKTTWTLQASAKPIQERDVICLLHGASKPSIIRLCKDHFAIVVIAATPLNGSGSFGRPATSQSITQFLRDFLLVWDWENLQGKSQDQEEYETLTMIYSQAPEYSKAEFGGYLDEATRLWNDITILDDLGEYEKADKRLLEARSGYMTAFRKEYRPGLNSEYCRTLLSFVAGEGHEDIVKLLLEAVDPDLKDGKSGRTPLSWAAERGHEAVVKLLLETGKVDADSKDQHYGKTPLSWAAERGHEAIVKLLLKAGKVDADSKDESGWTPLWWATKSGHEAIVKLLLKTGKVDADSKDEDGKTPLLWAAESGHEAIVKLLLLETGKVDADSKDSYGRTPLSWAADGGHEAIVKLLLKTGKVDADSKDGYGKTPLLYAAESGHEAIVTLLLKTCKVDADSKDQIYGRTPLSRAADGGHEAIVKLLLETGKVDADSKDEYSNTPLLYAANKGHEAIVKLLLETYKVDADSKDSYGRTPLSWAADGGHEAIVKLLLKTGKVDADSKDGYGKTPLLYAAESGHEAIVTLLLKTCKVDADSKDQIYGRTPLSRAADGGHEAIVKLLLETGKVDADSKDEYSNTPLLYAANKGHEAIVKLLLETYKVDADSKDSYGRTPLSWAADGGHEAIVKLLLKTGKVDADSKDGYGKTPLLYAAESGHEAIVTLLLETYKVDADSKDSYGRTPLSWAADGGHEAIVKLLLKTGKVDADSKNSYGQTPLLWAAENGHEAIVKLLLEIGKVDADLEDKNGRTPLWWATNGGHEAVIKLLHTTV